MYAVYRGNRKVSKKNFTSYELARSWARKQIRKGKFSVVGNFFYDLSDHYYNNPSLYRYGLRIKAVN